MYLGIDLGTSSMKCLVIGEDQEIIHSVSSEDIPLSILKVDGLNKIHPHGLLP